MALIPPVSLRGHLQIQLRLNKRMEQAMIVALVVFEQQQVRHERRERTVWVKPWLLRGRMSAWLVWLLEAGNHVEVSGHQ